MGTESLGRPLTNGRDVLGWVRRLDAMDNVEWSGEFVPATGFESVRSLFASMWRYDDIKARAADNRDNNAFRAAERGWWEAYRRLQAMSLKLDGQVLSELFIDADMGASFRYAAPRRSQGIVLGD